MAGLLSQLTKNERARLLEELNYLNLAEIRRFCSAHGIPYKILAENPSGKVMITKDTDRKPIVLARMRDYLATGKVGPPTLIPAKIVRDDPPPASPGPQDRLYYRWYAKEHIGILRSLRELTTGRFRDGASHAYSSWSSGRTERRRRSQISRGRGQTPTPTGTGYSPRNTPTLQISSTRKREAAGKACA